MLSQILNFFQSHESDPVTLSVDDAAAVLLIEVMMADHDMDQTEIDCVTQILSERMSLSRQEVQACVDTALQRQKESYDLFQFTHIINEHYGEQERYLLLVDLWRVAFADGRLDKYEDHRIRRVSDMLHLHHSHFIRAKAEAKERS